MVTLTLTPPQLGLPSVEPITAAVLAALKADLDAALTLIEQQYQSPALSLPRPDATTGWTTEAVNSYDVPQSWPYVSVFGGNAVNDQPLQSLPGGGWKADLFVRVFLQEANGNLALMLYRYAVAVWLVIVNAGANMNLARAQIIPGSETIELDPNGGSQFTRAAQVSFSVEFRT